MEILALGFLKARRVGVLGIGLNPDKYQGKCRFSRGAWRECNHNHRFGFEL